MRAIACTGNEHKVHELQELLPMLQLEPMPAGLELPEETGDTFEENARIKARGGAAELPEGFVLADDSGLEVDALGGAPGVWSARYAGEDATDQSNVELLLQRLDEVGAVDAGQRSARFRCVLVAITPDGDELVAHGTVEGHVAAAPRGEHGFGYDPVFVPLGEQATFAELGEDAKSAMSHRAAAAQVLAARLEARGG